MSQFIDITSLSYEEYSELAKCGKNQEFEEKHSEAISKYVERCKPRLNTNDITNSVPMKFYEEIVPLIILGLGVPGAVFSLPVIIVIIGYFTGSVIRAIAVALTLLFPLAVIPAPFVESSLSSWICFQILRYFSLKIIYEEVSKPNIPRILVAPPHGVFPMGNIIVMMGYPSVFGFSFRGLSSSAALRTPIFRQLLSTIGVIDASRETANRALKRNLTLGISTGGVAEVFETNSSSGNEVIILKSRVGLVKLAFRSGAEIVPCYLFGNTLLYDLFTGGSFGHSFLRNLSRRIGFALILFWGRFFLPIPYRVPILGVMGKAIKVPKNDNPSDEDVKKVHERLMSDMMELFNKYKGLYGWADKKLVIE